MLSFFNNPVSFAILAVAAIGFLVYEIIDSNKERQQRQQHGRGRGSGPPPPPPYGRGNEPPPPPPYGRGNRPPHGRDNRSPPPPSHSRDNGLPPPPPHSRGNGSPPPPPNGRDSGSPPPPPHEKDNGPPPPPPHGRDNRPPPPLPMLDPRESPLSSASPSNTDNRKRKPKKRSESESEGLGDSQTESASQKTVTSDRAKENSTSPDFILSNPDINCINKSDSEKTDFILSNPDINCINKSDSEKTYEKNVLSETTDSDLRSKNKVRRRRSFKKSVSDSAKSSKSSSIDKKLNSVSLRRNNVLSSHSDENQLSEQTDESGKISYTSDNCLSSTDSMLSYKRNVCENIQNDIAKRSQHDIDYSSSSSPESNVHEDHAICESDICLACEENRVNTRAEPCNHRYLCLSCARRVYRMYKKCYICHCNVLQFRMI